MKRMIHLVLASLFFVIACMPSALSKPSKPKTGHWEGSDPTVSFDITEEGQIANFSMRVPYGGSTCDIYITSAIIQPDHSITLELTSMETLSMGYIIGAFQSQEVSGKYLIEMCSQGISFVPGEDKDRDWSAEWVKELESSDPPNPVESMPPPDPTQETLSSTISDQQTMTFNLDAQRSTWFDTGIVLQITDEIRIEASGRINLGGVDAGPDGNPDIQPLGLGIIPDAPYGMLIGRIGAGNAFHIGSNYQGAIQNYGTLFLLINDVAGQYDDNAGQFIVIITITRRD